LAKEDLTEWIKKVHESGDGSPKGLVAALGWEKIVAKTTNDVLIAVLDAMVTKVGLVKPADKGETPAAPATGGGKSIPPAASTSSSTPSTAKAQSTVPPADIDWNEPDAKSGRAPSPTGEIETTVSQSGAGQLAPAPAHAAGDGGEEIVVVDDVDLNDTGVGVTPPGVREEPETSPKMVAASPVDPDEEPPVNKPVKGLSKRPEPSAPPAARPLRGR